MTVLLLCVSVDTSITKRAKMRHWNSFLTLSLFLSGFLVLQGNNIARKRLHRLKAVRDMISEAFQKHCESQFSRHMLRRYGVRQYHYHSRDKAPREPNIVTIHILYTLRAFRVLIVSIAITLACSSVVMTFPRSSTACSATNYYPPDVEGYALEPGSTSLKC